MVPPRGLLPRDTARARGHARRSTVGALAAWRACGLALSVFLLPASVRSAEASLDDLVTRLVAAWNARDAEAYLALWEPGEAASLAAEREALAQVFASDECRLDVRRTRSVDLAVQAIDAHSFCVREPQGSLTYLSFRARRGPSGWWLAGRQPLGEVAGLVHLQLGESGTRADGRRLRLEDFELEMRSGFLFPTVEEGGPTALVFVGDGTVRFRPWPDAERQQLRLFARRPELVARVRQAFIRLHPLDLEKVLTPGGLDPAPEAARSLKRAREVLARHARASYVLESGLPRAPWWTAVPLGRSLVVFETRRGTLTFAVTSQPEAIGLFDLEGRLQISLYRSAEQPSEYSEGAANDVDIQHHDLRVQLDPRRRRIQAEDRIHLRALTPGSTIRLRLDGALNVESVTSSTGTPQVFFRASEQDLLLVSLDPEVYGSTEITLTVRYAGLLMPAERDTDQPMDESEAAIEQQVSLLAPQAYSTDPPWYPRAEFVDYSTYRLRVDLPEDYEAVSGGERQRLPGEGGRVRVEHVQQVPSRYITLVVGRLYEAGIRETPTTLLRGYGTPATRAGVSDLLVRAAAIVSHFDELFGPNPYPTLNVIHSEAVTPGGHSPPGLVILARRALLLRRPLRQDPADFSDVADFFLAHELAHQWWGHGVAPANYRERWLSEGFAHYAAALWVEHSQGQEAFRAVVGRMARWAIAARGDGPVNLGRRVGHVTGKSDAYRAVIYDKGALVVHMLRRLVGDEAFFSSLRELQASRRFTTATTSDLRRILERASGLDLEPFFDTWILGSAIPELNWSQAIEGDRQRGFTTRLWIGPTGLPGPFWMEATLTLPRETTRVRFEVPPGGGTFTLPTAERPRGVALNEDWGVLARLHRDSRLAH